MTGPTVRLLRREELDLFAEALPAWNSREYGKRLASQEQGRLAQLVAWDRDLPVGRAMLVFPGHEEWSISAHRENCPEVRDVMVAATHRRRGVATSLMAAIEQVAQDGGWSRVGLSVSLDGDATAARALYERLGYHPAHGPYIFSTMLEAEDGSSFAVGAVMAYLVKRW